MSNTSRRSLATPSALALDVALARVDLAALRARRGIEADTEARKSASLLRDYFSRRLRSSESSGTISAQLVPRQEVREALQKTLSAYPDSIQRFDQVDVDLIRQLVELLSSLGETGRCSRQDADKLHSALSSLESDPVLAAS